MIESRNKHLISPWQGRLVFFTSCLFAFELVTTTICRTEGGRGQGVTEAKQGSNGRKSEQMALCQEEQNAARLHLSWCESVEE